MCVWQTDVVLSVPVLDAVPVYHFTSSSHLLQITDRTNDLYKFAVAEKIEKDEQSDSEDNGDNCKQRFLKFCICL